MLEPLAKARGCTLAQHALSWCMGQPGVTSPIIGPRTMEQLEDNLGALDVTIDDDERAKIDELVPPGSMFAPFYEATLGRMFFDGSVLEREPKGGRGGEGDFTSTVFSVTGFEVLP